MRDVHTVSVAAAAGDKESFGTYSDYVVLREACDWNRRWVFTAFLKGEAPRPKTGPWAAGEFPREAVGFHPAQHQECLRPSSAPLLEFQAGQGPQCQRLPSWFPPLFRKRVALGQFLSFVPTRRCVMFDSEGPLLRAFQMLMRDERHMGGEVRVLS